jgi:hypothetical protein
LDNDHNTQSPIPTNLKNLSSQHTHISLASQDRLVYATVAAEDQPAFKVAQKLLQAYILSKNPWPTMEESKLLALKAWDSALNYQRNEIEVQGQDGRILTERTVPDKNILKLVCIYSGKICSDFE